MFRTEEESALVSTASELTQNDKIKLTEFLNWFDRTILKKKSTKLETAVSITAIFFANIATYPAIPLGGEFGKTIGELTNANQQTINALSALFSTIAFIPICILFNVNTRAGFRELISSLTPDAKLFNKQDHKFIRKALAVFKYTLSPFGAIPFMAYTKQYLNNDLGTAVAIILLASMFGANLRAQSMIFENVFITLEADAIKTVRKALNTRISRAIQSIQKMPAEDVPAFYQQFTNNVHSTLTEKEILEKFILLLNPPRNSPSETPSRKTLPSWYNATIDVFSFSMASAAMYPLYAGANAATEWFCNATGIMGDDKERLKIMVSVFSISTASLFCGFHARNKFKNTSESFLNKEFCPTKASATAIGFSAAASTMPTVIAQQSGSNPLFMIPAFVMPTAMRVLAFEILIGACKRRYNNYRFPNDATTQRENLINLLVTLKGAIELMDTSYLFTLETAAKVLAESMSFNPVAFPFAKNATEVELANVTKVPHNIFTLRPSV
jgi:hypothetical protein